MKLIFSGGRLNGISHCQALTMREFSFTWLLRWEDPGSPALEDRGIVPQMGSHNSCLETYQWSDKDASSTSWARESLQCSCLVQRQLSCCLPSSPHFVISHTTSPHLAQLQLIRQPHTFRVLQEPLQRPGLLELPPCATFISPSVNFSLGHIPFSKLQLCFPIPQPLFWPCLAMSWPRQEPPSHPHCTSTCPTLSLLYPLLLGDAHHRLKGSWGALDGIPQVIPELVVCLS